MVEIVVKQTNDTLCINKNTKVMIEHEGEVWAIPILDFWKAIKPLVKREIHNERKSKGTSVNDRNNP